MNAEFKIGKVKRQVPQGDGQRDVEEDGELIIISGGFLGKDAIPRPATDEDRATYKAEHDEFKKSDEYKKFDAARSPETAEHDLKAAKKAGLKVPTP